MVRRLAALGIVSGLLWAASVLPASAASSWTVTQLTTVNEAPYYAGVSGDRVIWQATAGSPRRLWTWKAGVAAPFLVSTQYMWASPKVSGDRIAWLASGGGDPFTVNTWKAGDPTVTVVKTSTTEVPEYLQLSGDRLVWVVDYTKVVTWKVGDSQPTTLNVGAFQASNARVDGDRVVWEESNGSSYQVAMWTPGGGSVWVTNDSLQHVYPVVSGNRIAWNGETPDAGGWAIYSKTVTDSVPTTVAITDYLGVPVALSGDRIAWRQIPAGWSTYQVFTWHAGEDSPSRVTSSDNSQAYVDLSGDRITWIDLRNVMSWKAGDSTLSVVATASGSPWDTRVSGDRIAWLVDGQVMTAVLSSPTALSKPTVSPASPTHKNHAHFSTIITPGGATLAAGGTTTLKLYRWESKYVTKKISGHYRKVKVYYWHLRNSVRMSGSGSGATQKLTATATPAYAGKWLVKTVYSGAPGFSGSTSAHRDFTVK